MQFPQKQGPPIILPDSIVNSGILIAGGTGSGKTVLMHQIIADARERRVRFVVHDAAMEYVPLWFRPGVDVILNPFDARCPYWSIGDELRHDGEAPSVARSLVPPNPRNPRDFFVEGPWKLLSHLLTLKRTNGQEWAAQLHVDRPTCEDLCQWLSDHDLLDKRLEGSGLEDILAHDAPQQRGGVHAALGMVADALTIVPRAADATAQWSARTWAEQPGDGCIFVTSNATTRARLVPLQSLWLDLLILRLMSATPQPRETVFILDELAVLDTLSQLHTAVTENRKFRNPMVIGTQDPAQLEVRYGAESRTILSQFATSIILKLNDPPAQEWASKKLGDVEIQRLQESRRDGWILNANATNHNLVWQKEPVAMPSEIGGLDTMTGYIKVGNSIARMDFTYDNLKPTQPAFIERPRTATPMKRNARRPPASSPLNSASLDLIPTTALE
ncbi:MAG: type IV secretion system DNA-binding domain-containing protein [Acidobacteriota bacterium]